MDCSEQCSGAVSGAGCWVHDCGRGGNRSVQRTCLSPVAGSSGGLFVVPGCLYVRGPPTRCVCVWTGQDGRVEGQAGRMARPARPCGRPARPCGQARMAVWQGSPAVWKARPVMWQASPAMWAGQPGHVDRPARPPRAAPRIASSCAAMVLLRKPAASQSRAAGRSKSAIVVSHGVVYTVYSERVCC